MNSDNGESEMSSIDEEVSQEMNSDNGESEMSSVDEEVSQEMNSDNGESEMNDLKEDKKTSEKREYSFGDMQLNSYKDIDLKDIASNICDGILDQDQEAQHIGCYNVVNNIGQPMWEIIFNTNNYDGEYHIEVTIEDGKNGNVRTSLSEICYVVSKLLNIEQEVRNILSKEVEVENIWSGKVELSLDLQHKYKKHFKKHYKDRNEFIEDVKRFLDSKKKMIQ